MIRKSRRNLGSEESCDSFWGRDVKKCRSENVPLPDCIDDLLASPHQHLAGNAGGCITRVSDHCIVFFIGFSALPAAPWPPPARFIKSVR